MAWQIKEAKADLSALIRVAETAGPQTITRNGIPVVVVLSQADYETLHRIKTARSGPLLAFFQSCPAPLEIPPEIRTMSAEMSTSDRPRRNPNEPPTRRRWQSESPCT